MDVWTVGPRRFLLRRRILSRPAAILLVGWMCVAGLACERFLAPQHNALGDLRRQSTAGVGPFIGRVRERDSLGRCWRPTPPVPGMRVEIGLWDGSPAYYRDTLTGHQPTELNEPRFHLLAYTVSDAEGRFRFDSMPRREAYAMRVIPPRGSTWGVGYGDTMFGVPNGSVLPEFPTLCVSRR